MRASDSKHAGPKLSVAELRVLADAQVKAKGFPNRTEALRRVNMSQTSFERLLREGLPSNPRKDTEAKLRKLGMLDLIPRR